MPASWRKRSSAFSSGVCGRCCLSPRWFGFGSPFWSFWSFWSWPCFWSCLSWSFLSSFRWSSFCCFSWSRFCCSSCSLQLAQRELEVAARVGVAGQRSQRVAVGLDARPCSPASGTGCCRGCSARCPASGEAASAPERLEERRSLVVAAVLVEAVRDVEAHGRVLRPGRGRALEGLERLRMAAARVVGAALLGGAPGPQQHLVEERPASRGSLGRGCWSRCTAAWGGGVWARAGAAELSSSSAITAARPEAAGSRALAVRGAAAAAAAAAPARGRPRPIASGTWKRSFRRYENSRASDFCSMPSSAAASPDRLVSAGVMRKAWPPVPLAIASSVVMSSRETTALPPSSRL